MKRVKWKIWFGISLIVASAVVYLVNYYLLGDIHHIALCLGGNQMKRTENNMVKHPNRLIHEKSPYLLQHSYNPVDWYPWGEEAFEKAKEEEKPIFLSIGYSTCHWCHVMGRESFEDLEVAKLMNETLICIKVDREERPDIDGAYMTVCQAMTGSGGWPLTIIMTPDKKPFFAATYIPKEARFGRIGMKELIPRMKELWALRGEEVISSAERIADELLRQTSSTSRGDTLDEKILDVAYKHLSQSFDEHQGGFSSAPKFPTPHNLTFLLRYGRRTGNERALRMVEKTLTAMRLGGIYDHVGFGFHRYSTDSRWLVPHFEKMIYDQAMLAIAYVEGYQVTGREKFKRTAQEILTYVLRDMTAPEGGFYSADDADSEGEEGKFYLWTEGEIRGTLSKGEANFVIKVFNVVKEGNFEDEATGKIKGRNILHLRKSLIDLASELGISSEELRKRLEKARQKLLDYREKRIRPHKDEKILTDWNGLMIAAMAKAAQAFDRAEYADAAMRAADFVLTGMRYAEGRLYHRYRDGEAAIPGFLDDYAFLIWGLIEIYEATFKANYLEKAIELTKDMVKHFWNEKDGGFYFTANDAETVLFRKKEVYDGATPSGNSVAMMNLIHLSHMIANSSYRERAAQIVANFSEAISRSPSAYTQLLSALEFELGNPYEIVIVGDPELDETKAMLKAIRGRFIPNKVVILHPTVTESPKIDLITGYTEHLSRIDGRTTAYICQNYSCKRPTTDVREVIESLEDAGKGDSK